VSLKVRSGEIVGIAGVSGNGQPELIEVLSGQREPTGAAVSPSTARRSEPTRDRWTLKVFGLPRGR
jgi:simple sugar transport system ATP-binding protein